MIYYRKKLLNNLAEIWYNSDEIPNKKIDILRYKFVKKINKNKFFFEELYTLLINMKLEEKELLSNFRKNTRYEINRALNKDKIKCSTLLEYGNNNISKINEYIKYYNSFAKSKNRSSINIKELENFIICRNLCIRYAFIDTTIITMHAYVISDSIARLHQSCSLFRNEDNTETRNMIARGNRLLHWDDIIYFKNLGLNIYDLGGWYGGSINKEQLLINNFKESFGGYKKKEYSYIVPVTFFGYISVIVHSLIKFLYSLKS